MIYGAKKMRRVVCESGCFILFIYNCAVNYAVDYVELCTGSREWSTGC